MFPQFGILPTNQRWTVSLELNKMTPPHWASVRLGDVASVQNGSPFESHLFSNASGFPLIRIRDVGAQDTKTYFQGEYDSAYIVNRGDIVIGMDGEFRCARWAGRPALLNQRVCRVKVQDERVLEAWMFLILPIYLKGVEEATSSVTVKHLSSKTIADLILALPPIEEQRRIVTRVGEMMARSRRARGALTGQPDLVEKAWSSALELAFRGELTQELRNGTRAESAHSLLERMASTSSEAGPRRGRKRTSAETGQEESLPALPSGWAWARLDQLTSNEPNALVDGPFGSNLKTADYVPEGARVIRLGNIGPGYFLPEDESYVSLEKFESLRKHEALPGDLVIAALAEPVGRACMVPTNLGPALVKADCIRMRPHSLLNSTYLMHAINEPRTHRRIEEHAHGIGRLRINLGELRATWIPVAPHAEQEAIVERLEQIRAKLNGLTQVVEEELQRLTRLDESILAAAFSGDLGL